MRRLTRDVKRLAHAWFSLTPREQNAALVVLGIVLLGLAVRYWHLHAANIP